MRIVEWLRGPGGTFLVVLACVLMLSNALNRPYVIPASDIAGPLLPGVTAKQSLLFMKAEHLEKYVGDGKGALGAYGKRQLESRRALAYASGTALALALLAVFYFYRSRSDYRQSVLSVVRLLARRPVLAASAVAFGGGMLAGDALIYFPARLTTPAMWFTLPGFAQPYIHFQFDFKEFAIGAALVAASVFWVSRTRFAGEPRAWSLTLCSALIAASLFAIGLFELRSAHWFTTNETVRVFARDIDESEMALVSVSVRERYLRVPRKSADGVRRSEQGMLPGTRTWYSRGPY